MKLFVPLGILLFVLSFCGITQKIQEQLKGSGSSTESSQKKDDSGSSSESNGETPTLTAKQQAIIDSAASVEWPDQGITWKIPNDWPKMDVKKESFNYGAPKTGFLLVTISALGPNFPAGSSLTSYYDSAVQQMRNGKYENVRYADIDGVKGVEWVEAMPEDSSSPRRHQWIGYRSYQGQTQMLNVMLTTSGDKFKDRDDTFSAILYSMKISK